MKIQIIFLNEYYLRETKFCFTALNFSNRKCVNRTMPKKHLNASTYNNDKICDHLKQKVVEDTRDKFRQRLTHKAATQAYMNRETKQGTRNKFRLKKRTIILNNEGGAQKAYTQGS